MPLRMPVRVRISDPACHWLALKLTRLASASQHKSDQHVVSSQMVRHLDLQPIYAGSTPVSRVEPLSSNSFLFVLQAVP